jgi:hypothetical protein
MTILETIHLRLAGGDPNDLVDVILRSVDSEPALTGFHIYRHASIDTDLVVHLHWGAEVEKERGSALGARLASVLGESGMVEHSVWVEVTSTAHHAAPMTR